MKYLQRLSSSNFLKNVVSVATGIAAAQAITLAFMPFLTRLYGAEEFGGLAAFNAIANIITPLATLGFANSIVMPSNEEKVYAIARLSVLLSITISSIFLIIIMIFNEYFLDLFGLDKSSNVLYFIPLYMLFLAFLSVANQILIRKGLFVLKSKSYVISILFMNVGKLIGGFFYASSLVLIFFLIVSRLFNFLIIINRKAYRSIVNIKCWFGFKGIIEAAKEQKDFAIYQLPQHILSAAAVGVPVIILNQFSGASAGYYSLTIAILGAPVVLLGKSVGEVFYPRITESIRNRKKESFRIIVKATILLAISGIIPFGIIGIWGADIFKLFFGSEWVTAGRYAQWLSIWFFFSLATNAIVSAYPILRIQSILLYQEIFSLVIRIIVLLIGFKYFESDIIAIALFSIVGALLSCFIIIVGFWRARRMTNFL